MNNLKKSLEKLQLDFSQQKIDAYKNYMDHILEWNNKVNLTAITNEDEFVSKHYIDSLLCVHLDEYKSSKSVLDMGTGAGFPGIPLAIYSDDKFFTLADSLNKRIKIINSGVEACSMNNVKTIHGRAEELARKMDMRETFDLCVSRAVANLSVLVEYCLPFVKVGGFLLAYKGPVAEKELAEASSAIKILGGEFMRIEPAEFEGYKHNIIVIKKVKHTGAKYPRKSGTPSKEPIK